MKRKFILLPITLTALSPMVSLVSCNEPEPTPTDEIIVDDFKYDTTLQCLKTTINLEASQKYCFVIKAKDYSLTDLNV
ncbi:MAG: hypothetical protein MJ201_05425 [Mycoplasmoidaceae bacterium]|nr:hypothetical protein [Mycoplasmoidaceae bacterium]